MIVREFNANTDYSYIQEWGEKQEWPILPVEYYGLKGFIAYNNDIPIAVGFIYRLDEGNPLCMLEWLIGNPDADWKIRKEGISKVIDACFTWAKEDGAEVVITMTKNKRLIEKYKEKDFIETDTNMTHLMRRL